MQNRKTYLFSKPDPALSNLTQFEWNARNAFTLYGARIGVQSNRVEGLNALMEIFPPRWRPYHGAHVDAVYSLYLAPPTRSGRRPFHTLFGNADQLIRSHQVARLADTFEREMQLALAQAARRKVFVHAGVVGWRGRAILIPGRTFTGKSTLVRELVRAGAVYYSDEYAVLDDKGRVHPFARPLALRNDKLVNEKLPFQELGGTIGEKAIPVGTILVAEYRAGAKWRPRTLTPGVGTLALLANTVTARSGQPLVLEVLSRVAMNAQIYKSARGEARGFAVQLLEALG